MNRLSPDPQSQFDRLLVVPPTMDIPYDVEDFYAQHLDTQLDQLDVISSMYRPSVDELFANTPDAKWIIVGIPTGEIIKTRLDSDQIPATISDAKILAQEAVTRCLPMVFVRPIVDHPGRG